MNKGEHLLDDVAHEELVRRLANIRRRIAIVCVVLQLIIIVLFFTHRLLNVVSGRFDGLILLVVPIVNSILRIRYRAPTPY